MSGSSTNLKPKTVVKPKLDQPKMYKVILVNDDFTPREFVIMVLKAVFRMSEEASLSNTTVVAVLGLCSERSSRQPDVFVAKATTPR